MQGWDPFRDLEELNARLGELMRTATHNVHNPEFWTPLTDVEETEDAWVVELEVPGVKPNDISVEVRDSSELVVTGEIKERERAGILRRRTRPVGRFEYRVALPGETDRDRIEASLSDGVLTVRVPKSERSQPRRIQVASGVSSRSEIPGSAETPVSA
jgi:HSP20 family protein